MPRIMSTAAQTMRAHPTNECPVFSVFPDTINSGIDAPQTTATACRTRKKSFQLQAPCALALSYACLPCQNCHNSQFFTGATLENGGEVAS